MGAEVLPLKQNAPVFTEALCRPRIPSPLMDILGSLVAFVNFGPAAGREEA